MVEIFSIFIFEMSPADDGELQDSTIIVFVYASSMKLVVNSKYYLCWHVFCCSLSLWLYLSPFNCTKSHLWCVILLEKHQSTQMMWGTWYFRNLQIIRFILSFKWNNLAGCVEGEKLPLCAASSIPCFPVVLCSTINCRSTNVHIW